MIAVRPIDLNRVQIVIDVGDARATTSLDVASTLELASLLQAAASESESGYVHARARRVDDTRAKDLARRILKVACPGCRRPAGVECTIGKTPHADRRIEAVNQGWVDA